MTELLTSRTLVIEGPYPQDLKIVCGKIGVNRENYISETLNSPLDKFRRESDGEVRIVTFDPRPNNEEFPEGLHIEITSNRPALYLSFPGEDPILSYYVDDFSLALSRKFLIYIKPFIDGDGGAEPPNRENGGNQSTWQELGSQIIKFGTSKDGRRRISLYVEIDYEIIDVIDPQSFLEFLRRLREEVVGQIPSNVEELEIYLQNNPGLIKKVLMNLDHPSYRKKRQQVSAIAEITLPTPQDLEEILNGKIFDAREKARKLRPTLRLPDWREKDEILMLQRLGLRKN